MGNTNSTIHVSVFEYTIDDILTIKYMHDIEPSITWIPFMVGQEKYYKNKLMKELLNSSLSNIPKVELNSDNTYTKDKTYKSFKDMLINTMKHTKNEIGYNMQLIMKSSCFPILDCLSEIISEGLISLQSIEIIFVCDNMDKPYFDTITRVCNTYNIDLNVRICNLYDKTFMCKSKHIDSSTENNYKIEKCICNMIAQMNTENDNTAELNECTNQLIQVSIQSRSYFKNVKTILDKMALLTDMTKFDKLTTNINNYNAFSVKSMFIPFILDDRLPKRRITVNGKFMSEYYIDDTAYYTNMFSKIFNKIYF